MDASWVVSSGNFSTSGCIQIYTDFNAIINTDLSAYHILFLVGLPEIYLFICYSEHLNIIASSELI
jgi:hypothetical protein